MTDRTVILASTSRTRLDMLTRAGLALEAVPARIDESAIKDALRAEGAAARDVAFALAGMKAQRLDGRVPPGAFVLGADQMLVCDGRWFDKPDNRAQAADQLRALRGRTHELISAAVIRCDGRELWRDVQSARLTMRDCSDAFIDEYLTRAGEAVCDSVGAYQLEGLGAQLFAAVDGDPYAILGLPLLPLLAFLRGHEVVRT